MEYLQAERTLATAEELAWKNSDWDSLARLYMPLQESRRQRRQRCGEGAIRLDFIATATASAPAGQDLIQSIQHGSAIVAGWASIQPAVAARQAQSESNLYVDIFLAAAYPMQSARVIAIVPRSEVMLPPPRPTVIDQLIRRLPAHSIVLTDADLAATKTFADIMALWERLHAPYLAAADATADPVARIAAYRNVIRVDYACELAHQKLSDTARSLSAGAKT